MKIEIGKYYRTRDGQKVGPMSSKGCPKDVMGGDVICDTQRWFSDGRYLCSGDHDLDLVTEFGDEDAELTAIAEDRRDGPFVPVDLDKRDAPKTWGEMTGEEKGALLLAFHEGKTIQQPAGSKNEWIDIQEPLWFDDSRYRIKPAEPKRETVTIEGWMNSVNDVWFGAQDSDKDIKDLRITFDVVDGKPHCSSVRMKEV